MARNLGLYYALRLVAWCLPFLPVRVVYRCAALAGSCAYFLLPGPRHGITSNLAHVLGTTPRNPTVRRCARRAFQHDAMNWVDTLRIAALRPEEILDMVEVEGWDHLEEAVAGGKGVVLVTMHLGNFDLVGQVLTAHGLRLTIPVERMQPERLFKFLLQERSSKGINIVPVDRAPREMIRALKAGEIVGVAGDRSIAGRRVLTSFFGAQVPLPRGPVSLAQRTGAPLLVGVGIRLPSHRFHGYVTPPLSVVRGQNAEHDLEENVRRLAAVMASFITRFPDQWLVFTPLWQQGKGGDGPATIGQQERARM